MTGSDITPIDRDEVELLLPWYVANTLNAEDKARVSAFLETTSEFDTQLATLREDQFEAIASNETIRGPAPGALDRLMAQVEQEPRKQSVLAASSKGLFGAIEQFLTSLTPGRLGFAAMAAAAVIVVQAALLGSSAFQGGQNHTTASGEFPAATGAAFLIQFNPAVNVATISQFLEENDAIIVSGPNDGGLFKIRIGTKELDDAAQQALLTKLTSRTKIVELALPSD